MGDGFDDALGGEGDGGVGEFGFEEFDVGDWGLDDGFVGAATEFDGGLLGDGAEGDEEERQEDSAEPGEAADIVRRRHGSRDRGAGRLAAQRAARGTSGRGARVRGVGDAEEGGARRKQNNTHTPSS